MALNKPSTNDIILATDVSDIVDHLEGASDTSLAWFFRTLAANNFIIRLADSSGAQKFSIQDSGGNEVASIDSDGVLTAASTTFTSLDIPTSAAPSQTAEGRMVWDSDDDKLTIGDGSSRKTFVPDAITTIGDIQYADSVDTLARLGIGTAGQSLMVNSGATAPTWSVPSLEANAQQLIVGGVHQNYFQLGGAPGASNVATATNLGLGFLSIHDGGALLGHADTASTRGSWKFSTGGAGTNHVGIQGPRVASSVDWTLSFRATIPAAASQTIFIGAKATATTPADENNLIGFRVVDTGNVIGVCDSAGTETTRDTSATGASAASYRIEVRDGGTVVRFYKNNSQVGADVTTNIASGAMYIVAGVIEATAADKVFYLYDITGRREV